MLKVTIASTALPDVTGTAMPSLNQPKLFAVLGSASAAAVMVTFVPEPPKPLAAVKVKL